MPPLRSDGGGVVVNVPRPETARKRGPAGETAGRCDPETRAAPPSHVRKFYVTCGEFGGGVEKNLTSGSSGSIGSSYFYKKALLETQKEVLEVNLGEEGVNRRHLVRRPR
jgi:hypothetical protein